MRKFISYFKIEFSCRTTAKGGSMDLDMQRFSESQRRLDWLSFRSGRIERTNMAKPKNRNHEIYGDPAVVNRSVVTVKVKKPYVDWANTLPEAVSGDNLLITLEELNESPTAFLIPAFEEPSSVQKYLQEMKPRIFEQQLNAWCTEPAWWPKHRSARAFNQWFEVEVSEMTFDLADDGPLEHEKH
ncbi:MAG: hypothetical protein K2X47_12230 [Bdellovibrionales bacterium]|nr:hypothetical protein [Bdellovibrionales bacterium]